jgi:hypothetical protein
MGINSLHRKVRIRQFEGENLLLSALDWWYREFITVFVRFVYLDDLGLTPSLALAAFCLTLERGEMALSGEP